MEQLSKTLAAISRMFSVETADLRARLHRTQAMSQAQLLLAAQDAAARNRALAAVRTLADVEFRVFSQWGEDGIIGWIIDKLPPMPEIFIEFGVESYQEANTRYLLQTRNWRGLVMDGSQRNMERLRSEELCFRHDITPAAHFITRENIDAIIEEHGFAGEIGLLSIDIDGNDYWVWEAISRVDPVIVICEYSALLGDIHPLSIPYSPDFTRFAAHFSGQYAGASIQAFLHLAERRGYSLLGTNSAGLNAFFIRKDYFPHIAPLVEHKKINCSRFSDTRDEQGRLTYLRGEKRLELIGHLPAVNVQSGETRPIADWGPAYSPDFLGQMRGAACI